MTERWLVTGASGQLGGHVVAALLANGAPKKILALRGRGDINAAGAEVAQVDLRDEAAVRATVRAFRPSHLLHVGALSAVGDCFTRPDDAQRINVDATRALADEAENAGAVFVYTSTDMVFAGDAAPYREDSPVRPLSVYGKSKAAGEDAVRGHRDALIVRIPLMYGFSKTQRPTTFANQIAALRAGQPLKLFVDEYRTPLWLADAAKALIGLARARSCGLIHVTGPERLSRFDIIYHCMNLLGIKNAQLVGISRRDIDAPEPRPEDLSLDGSAFAREFPHLAPGPLRSAVFEGV